MQKKTYVITQPNVTWNDRDCLIGTEVELTEAQAQAMLGKISPQRVVTKRKGAK